MHFKLLENFYKKKQCVFLSALLGIFRFDAMKLDGSSDMHVEHTLVEYLP